MHFWLSADAHRSWSLFVLVKMSRGLSYTGMSEEFESKICDLICKVTGKLERESLFYVWSFKKRKHGVAPTQQMIGSVAIKAV